ncbi:hypothetical protein EVJ58_g10855, partial [Rhodofomes roseus]
MRMLAANLIHKSAQLTLAQQRLSASRLAHHSLRTRTRPLSPRHVPVKSSKIAIPVPEDDEKMHIQDRRGIGYDPLVQPSLRHENKLRPKSQKTIAFKILASQDDRVLAIVGPCSIHSPSQAIEYATLLKSKMPEWSNLHIIMRAYFEVRHWPALSVPHTLPVHLRPHLLGAIGARTTESQLHHELASSVSFPIGCKNGKDGS